MKLRELGEDRLLALLLPRLRTDPRVLVAAGDDCAVVHPPGRGKLLLLKTDCVVSGVHFTPSTDPGAVGWKAIMRPLSDFAAMAGFPEHALVTLIAPRNTNQTWVTSLYRGMQKAAARFAVNIVGGEISGGRHELAISVAVTGTVERKRMVTRSGGKTGDLLFVTGRLGGSIRGHHLNFVPRLTEARWLTEHFRLNAMMDLSDGLGSDLPRLAAASGLGFQLDHESVPQTKGCSLKQALTDGEDYELLFSIAPRAAEKLGAAWRRRFPRLPLTQIGRLTQRTAGSSRLDHGYLHFK